MRKRRLQEEKPGWGFESGLVTQRGSTPGSSGRHQRRHGDGAFKIPPASRVRVVKMIVTTLTSVKTANQCLLMVPAMEEGGPPGAPEADVTVPARPPQTHINVSSR